MRSEQLSDEQICALHGHLQPTADYLERLQQRMTKTFDPTDPLGARVIAAKRSLDELLAGLQPLSIEPLGKVPQKRRPKRKDELH